MPAYEKHSQRALAQSVQLERGVVGPAILTAVSIFDRHRRAIASGTDSASWSGPQDGLALCCDDEDQAAGHRHVL
jgi:hypothetical protein